MSSSYRKAIVVSAGLVAIPVGLVALYVQNDGELPFTRRDYAYMIATPVAVVAWALIFRVWYKVRERRDSRRPTRTSR